LSVSNINLEYSRVINSRDRQKQCLLGNPGFANHLYNWLHDTQEEISLQVTLFRNKPQDFLRTSVSIEVAIDKQEQIDNWQSDLSTVIAVSDPQVHWTRHSSPKKEWKHAILLETNGITPEEEPPERLIDTLFSVLKRTDIPLAIQSSFSLEWKKPRAVKRMRVPGNIHFHFQSNEEWKRHQRRSLEQLNSPKRHIRRRIILFSDQMMSSLTRQSVFRALIGTITASAQWRPLSSLEKELAHQAPSKALSFPTPYNDHIPRWEMRSMLTSNLALGKSHCHHNPTPHDDIPF
jgi:hypothetical protein